MSQVRQSPKLLVKEWARSRRAGLARADPVSAKIWGLKNNKQKWVGTSGGRISFDFELLFFLCNIVKADNFSLKYICAPTLMQSILLPEVLHVILDTRQSEGIADRTHKCHCLCGRTPVHIWREPGSKLVCYNTCIRNVLPNMQTPAHSSPGFLTVT